MCVFFMLVNKEWDTATTVMYCIYICKNVFLLLLQHVVWRREYVHRTRKHKLVSRSQCRHSLPKDDDQKQELRPVMSTTSSQDQTRKRTRLSLTETTVLHDIILSHGQVHNNFCITAIQHIHPYFTKQQLHRFKTTGVFAVAACT